MYRAADRTWAVSELDRRAIAALSGVGSKARSLPIITDVAYYAAVCAQRFGARRTPDADSGPTIFYAGAYWWQPNLEAAHELIAEIFPRLRAMCPAARLVLIGASPTDEMQAAARADDHIVVTGQIDDLRPYLAQADVVAVPLLNGGGIRSKILEAFAAGVPVVSTTKGAEGIDVVDGRDLLLRDGAAEFAAGIKELWDEPERARSDGATRPRTRPSRL